MKYRIKDFPDLKEKVEKMSIRELLMSVIVPHLEPGDKQMFRETPGVFVFPAKAEDCIRTVNEINRDREEKALIVSDMEAGAGGALKESVHFPSLRAVTKAGSVEDAYLMGKYAAEEVRRAGYHWTFGPCVDITGNRDCPIVSVRAAGDTADEVIEYAGAYMRGLQENGLIATLKHFPGDGYSEDDQHITVPTNPLSKEEWYSTFGKVYKTLIEDGAMAVMPGHISLPAFDDKDEYMDMYPPATISKKVLTGLLREELGFEGIIVSDAVNMGGYCGYINWYKANCLFLEAGGDCLLFQKDEEEYFVEMEKLINEGYLSMETLKNRAYRNLCFSREYFETYTPDVDFDREAAEECAKRVGKGAVELYRDRAALLPIKLDKSSRVLHVYIAQLDYPIEAAHDLTERLREICGVVDVIEDPRPWITKEAVKTGNYDYIVVNAGVFPSYGLDSAKLTGEVTRNMMEGWMRYGTPAIFVCNGHPYFGEQFKCMCDTVINTYGYNRYTNERVLELILGENYK